MNFFIELDEKIFINNIKTIENITNKKIIPVVKANAYGHGLKEIMSILENINSISEVAVAYFEEAVEIKKLNSKKKIIITMPTDDFYFDEYFEFFLSSFIFLKQLITKAKKKKVIFKVHIEINTGMNRFGFRFEEISELFSLLQMSREYINVVGIASHLGKLDYEITQENKNIITKFEQIIEEGKKLFGEKILIHPFAGKGFNIINQISIHSNAIRPGGIIYGLITSERKKNLIKQNAQFSNDQIITLKAKILSINKVKKNEHIGYADHYIAKEDRTIIVVAFGYSLGYDFLLSFHNGIEAWYKNTKITLVGLVGMNHICFDVTVIEKEVELYDYVSLFASQQKLPLIADIAVNVLGKREYTLCAGLNPLIPKKIT
jgi:alanine racemase